MTPANICPSISGNPTRENRNPKTHAAARINKRFMTRSDVMMQPPYFGVTAGAVTEDQIKKYIENQSDEPGVFFAWPSNCVCHRGVRCCSLVAYKRDSSK